MKKFITVLLVVLLVLGTLCLAKNAIAKMAVSGGVKAITGLKLELQSMDVGFLRTAVGIKGLRLFNPRGFSDPMMAEIPELHVDYDLPAFFRGKVHLEEVKLYLKEFTVVKNEKGELNLNSLKTVQAAKEEKKAPSEKKKGKTPEIQIDVLDLQVGKVIYKDYSAGTPPKVTEFNINLHERHENITNPYRLGSLIVSRALFRTTVARLASFDLDVLEGQLTDTLKKYRGQLTEVAGTTRGAGGEIVGTAKEAAQEAVGTLKKIFPLEKEE